MARDEQTVDVDWRKFLLACSDWPKANLQDLLELRQLLQQIDVAGKGWILEEQFEKVNNIFYSKNMIAYNNNYFT